MRLVLNIWRQSGPEDSGKFERYDCTELNEDMSLLEALDVLNEGLIEDGKEPVAFDHDCREGICGSCGFMVNGVAHGPERATTVCQLHLRKFNDGDELWLEPWRATAFPHVRDLVVNRSAFDDIITSGGFVSVSTGSAPDANTIPISKDKADLAMDAAACIGCGACVAMCPNRSASLFTAAKMTHLNMLPQGLPERWTRALRMSQAMQEAGFGHCTNIGECETVCPKEIRLEVIAKMNRDTLRATLTSRD